MPLGRQFVATITALAVLLCGVVCVCGSAQDSARRLQSFDSSAVQPPCHRHHAGGDASPSKSGKERTPDHSCPHCQGGVSPQASTGSSDVKLPGLAPLPGPFLGAVSVVSSLDLTATNVATTAH